MPFRSSKQSIYDTSFYDISVKKTVHGVWPPVQSASWFLHVCTLFWLLFGNHVQELKDVKESRFKKVTMFQLSFDLKTNFICNFFEMFIGFLLIVSKDFFGIFHEKSWRGQGEEIGATTEKVTWFWSFTIWGGKCLLGVFFFDFTRQVCGCFFFRCFLWSIFFCWEILFWERNADGFRNLETSVRSYWGYVVASFASSFEQPIVRKWMHHDTKFH